MKHKTIKETTLSGTCDLNNDKTCPYVKGAICQHCFVYIKPFNFVNLQSVIGSHGATAKEVTEGLRFASLFDA